MDNSSTVALPDYWRKCSTCKNKIGFGVKYYVCSVTSCNKKRAGFVFCRVECADAHIAVMSHRDAGAFQKVAPTLNQWKADQEKESARSQSRGESSTGVRSQGAREGQDGKPDRPAVAVIRRTSSGQVVHRPEHSVTSTRLPTDTEILVVVSKVKSYIREKSGMNTSDGVMPFLSDRLRQWAHEAIDRARADGRKTVMDRDID